MSVNPQVSLKDISFSYGSHLVLDNISLDINKGDYLGIIGPNGGGKTTLIKIILGLIKPQSGKISIDGESVGEGLDKIRIGYVPQRISQEYNDLPATVYEIVESGKVAKSGILNSFGHKESVVKAIETAGLKGKERKLIGELSGGQRQRAFVARALAIEPEILVLDEPFVGIDLTSQKEFYDFLKEINKNKDITILFISHDLDMISKQAERILCLNHKIIYSGKASNVDEKKLVDDVYGKEFSHIHHDY